MEPAPNTFWTTIYTPWHIACNDVNPKGRIIPFPTPTITSSEPNDLITSMSCKILRHAALTDAPALCANITLTIAADLISSFSKLVTKVIPVQARRTGPPFLRHWAISCNLATSIGRLTLDFDYRNQWLVSHVGIPDTVPPFNFDPYPV